MPEITAHRGASHDAPENTLPAIELAWQLGADAVEIDLRLCATGEIVVIHDADTNRVVGNNTAVCEQSWEGLGALDVGSWKDSRFAGLQIPSLDEVLDVLPPGKQLQMEIKCGPEIIPALRDSLAKRDRTQFLLASFSRSTLEEMQAAFPDIPCFWICNLTKPGAPSLEEVLGLARAAGFAGLNLGIAEKLDTAIAAQVKAAELQLCVWPIDSLDLARKWADAGAEILTTNRPDLLCGHLK